MATTRELEQSKHQSTPIEFYHFYRSTEDWYYVANKRTRTLDGIAYTPSAITRGSIEYGSEDRPGALAVMLPLKSALGADIQAGALPTPLSLVITRQQPAATDEPAIIFVGEVDTAEVLGKKVNLQCLPFTARLGQTAPQGLYQRRQCQFNTYDPNTCKVNGLTFRFTGAVSAIDGLNITVDGAADFDPGTGTLPDMFALGTFGFGERKVMIESQLDDTVTIIERVSGLVVGSIVTLQAGDDRLPETCNTKFNNSARYLAFELMPVLNPFDGQGLRL